MLLTLLLAQAPTDPMTTGLLQYGAVGVLALAAVFVVRVLWKRQELLYEEMQKQTLDMYHKEVNRGDRLEVELLSLNKLVSGELSGHLVRATEAMREVTDMLKHRGDR